MSNCQSSVCKPSVAVVGLGYVGLPLAVALGTIRSTVGFDTNVSRIQELSAGFDRNGEFDHAKLNTALHLKLVSEPNDLQDAEIYIVTVPTPIDDQYLPDLTQIVNATQLVGKCLKIGDLVVYESTVYPGATEEICVPILETISGLKINEDFFVGYSPERINPGDKLHGLQSVVKIVSGSNTEAVHKVQSLYSEIVTVGLHVAPSIKVAEAAKVIENVQRDVNIALVNEFAQIFNLLDIETSSVLAAAGSKWNFHHYTPGLVGGHCIGVDPYYLTFKAKSVGFIPKMILAGRETNESMVNYVSDRLEKLLNSRFAPKNDIHVLVLGITFKENCSDLRNSKSAELVLELIQRGFNVAVCDPWANPEETMSMFDLKLISVGSLYSGPRLKTDLHPKEVATEQWHAIVLNVAHHDFLSSRLRLRENLREGGFVFDVKSALPADLVDFKL